MARVATRQGLQARSFELASEAYEDATGGSMSGESLRRVTEGWGHQVEHNRSAEVGQLFAITEPQTAGSINRVDPIERQANLSTDGGMVLVREEGWKEAKLVAISAVRPKTEAERSKQSDGRRYAPWEPQMMLERHSYQTGLWKADEAEQYQYLEGLRRGLPDCSKASSVNDGAGWIARITAENFPDMPQIVDWFHAADRLWLVGKALYGREQAAKTAWVEAQLDELWQGRVDAVIEALESFDLSKNTYPEEVESAPGYFARQQEKMHYHQYRVAGYPIGSGSAESGINTVIHHRLKRQGRGWKRKNGQAMLAALGELHSGRFDSSWQRTQAIT